MNGTDALDVTFATAADATAYFKDHAVKLGALSSFGSTLDFDATMYDLAELKRGLRDARQKVRNLTVMAIKPDLTPAKAELIRNMERSARAEVKLRQRHSAYVQSQGQE